MDNEKLKSTYKSGDTEEWLDIVFTRPIGYKFAMFYKRIHFTPNAVTVVSIILGITIGFFLVNDASSPQGLVMNIIGIVVMMIANFHDSADGQLARLTNQTSQLGRILDGVSADACFISVYFALALRLFYHTIPGTTMEWGLWGFALMAFDGFVCHVYQCNLSDYYRNIHLFFLKGEKGSELDSFSQTIEKYKKTTWKSDPVNKFFLSFYVQYTWRQEFQTPNFQKFFKTLKQKYGNDIPQNIRDSFREKSLPLMKWTNILTFNVRAISLYICCLLDLPWLYPLFEIIVLSAIYFHMRFQHEKFCKQFYNHLKNGNL